MWLLPAFALLGMAALVALATARRDGTFRISARTELVRLVTDTAESGQRLSPLQWSLAGDSLLVDGRLQVFSGQLIPGAGSTIQILRTGSGPVEISIVGGGQEGPVAVLRSADRTAFEAQREVVVVGHPDAARTYTLGYFGTAQLGRVVRSGGQAMLLSGEVEVLAAPLLGSSRFEAGSLELRMGDEVRLAQGTRCQEGAQTTGVGVVRLGAGPGMEVIHEGHGSAAVVSRARHAPLCFYPSLLSLLSNDPVVGGLLIFSVSLLIAVLEVFVDRIVHPVVTSDGERPAPA